MAREDKVERVWDIIEKVQVGMLTTCFAGGLRARPLDARPDRAAGVICEAKAYLSITGRATVLRDLAKAAEIWKATDKVWWPDGPEDQNLRVLRVDPTTAELWDGPSSSAVAFYEFAKARLTGEKPNLGENRKVTVPMS